MIEDQLNNETEIRRFLLGEITGNERTAFEEKFVADDDFFEQMRVVEDELIESYLRDALPLTEKEKFEQSFLTTERRRARVEFTRAMLDKLAQQEESAVVKKTDAAAAAARFSVWDSLNGFFKAPKFAFGAAFALLILIFGGWFLLRNPNQNEIVRQITPTPTVELAPPTQNRNLPVNENVTVNSNANMADETPVNKNSSVNSNRETPNTNQKTDTRKRESVITPILALFPGTVRGEGKRSVLNLPERARGANLQLNLESQDYKIYFVEITDADGNLVSRNNNLKAKNSKINLFIPAAKLRNEDYIVKLSALNAQNESESVADYTFRVDRK